MTLTSLGIVMARTEYCSNIVFSQNGICCLQVSQSVCLSVRPSVSPHSPTFPSGAHHQCAAETLKLFMMYICAEPQLGKKGGGGETAS